MVTSSGDGDGDGLALLLVHVPKHDLPLAGVFTNEAKMTGENLNIRKNFNDPKALLLSTDPAFDLIQSSPSV